MRPGMAAEGNATGRQQQRPADLACYCADNLCSPPLGLCRPAFCSHLGPRLGRCRAGETEHGRVLVGLLQRSRRREALTRGG